MSVDSSVQQTHSVAPEVDDRVDPADWTRLGEPGPIDAWCTSWLRIQTAWIGGVVRAAIVRRERDGAELEWLACSEDSDREGLRPQVEATFDEGGPLAAAVEGSEGRFGVTYHATLPGSARVVVAVEVARDSAAELPAVLRQLQWGSSWLERRLGGGVGAKAGDDRPGDVAAHHLLDLIALSLEARGFAESSQALVTRLARDLVCDRVSLGIEDRGQVELVAISHSAAFGREMNLVQAIERAMQEALDQHATLIHPESGEGAPLVLYEHEALGREHGAQTVLTIPLQREGGLRGALTFEHAEPNAFSRDRVAMLEAVALAVSPIFELWRRDDRSLFAKATDAARFQLERFVGPGHLGRKLAAALLVLAFLFFWFAKGDYRIGAEGVLEGTSRRVVIAPFDGYVAAAHRRAGDFVKEGEELARLDDRELELERLKWASRLIQLERQADESRTAREYGRTSILTAQIDEARAESARLEERLARTRVVAAFDGLVVSGDLSQSLGGAVSRGEVLFEIAPLEHYRVLLDVDEQQIADVEVGQSGQLLLASVPDEAVAFEVTKVTPVARAEEGHNFFRVEGTLVETSDRLRPGMEGVGKIEVDRRRLIWIWTRGFQNWLRLWVWSWWP